MVITADIIHSFTLDEQLTASYTHYTLTMGIPVLLDPFGAERLTRQRLLNAVQQSGDYILSQQVLMTMTAWTLATKTLFCSQCYNYISDRMFKKDHFGAMYTYGYGKKLAQNRQFMQSQIITSLEHTVYPLSSSQVWNLYSFPVSQTRTEYFHCGGYFGRVRSRSEMIIQGRHDVKYIHGHYASH